MNDMNIQRMNRKLRHMALTALLLLAGSVVVAQTNGQFVIKIDGHYMAHSGGVITDATTFDPATCLWTSDNTYTQGGTNKNYYYMDGTTPRFLAAPTFAPGGLLTLSNGLPSVSMSVPESPYYYYQWDGGLGRGVQYYGACTDSTYCVDVAGHTWGDGQCWDVYWVAYLDNTWKLSDNYYHLSDVPTGGKFYPVTITEHPQDTTVVSGGLASLTVPAEIEWGSTAASLSALINAYSYEVTQPYTTYVFQGGTHHYYDGHDNAFAPSAASGTGGTTSLSYAWSLSGDGAQYLTLSNAHAASPTLSYSSQNNTGHKTAIVKLTVTYDDGSKQTATATVLVKTPCQNPTVSANTVVTYAGATVSWVPTATSYKVFWRKQGASTWDEAEVGNVTSYTITGLEFNQTYQYTVQATSCTTSFPGGTYPTFTTLEEPGLMVTGAIFGGGRMADVTGKTEVVIVNCDSIGAIFGGNDIAGTVQSNDGSTITLGVDAGGTYASYGTTTGAVRVGSVYGGGNGYYAYNGSTFTPATSNTYTVPTGGSVTTQSQTNAWDEPVWTNTGTAETLTLPSIYKATVVVTNDSIKIDSVFGGAKNAYLKTASGSDGSSITINGGTILAVFGGNNVGGGQGYGWHTVTVNATTTNLTANIVNTATTGYGHDFGIRNLFGGGNKVTGSTTDVRINGGQIDNVFAGGNSADIYKANVTVNCAMGGDGTDNTWNKVYSNAIDTYSGGVITPKTDYGWDGINGIYNVRTLYGGNNEAEMQRVPTMNLTSGSIGTVYGGGNAGDMMGNATDNGNNGNLVINGNDVQYGTHVVMNSDNIIADYLYGGCRMSDVANSTWVELKKGHVGTVYGGCNISGDVGSTRVNVNAPNVPATLDDQEVKGGTYVVAGGNNTDNIVVYKDLFAGSNGYYNCSTDGIHYISDTYFDDPTGQYAGMEIPTHNETNVIVSTGATIKGNVYAGGNMASVGFDDGTGFNRGYPELIGLASVRMDGGLVEQNVYGGGNMASIFGKNEVMVTGGRIMLGLYGGNDRAGQVAEKTNRIMPPEYDIASDGKTSLSAMGIKTYVGVSGNAQVGTVYGGGNGDYPPGSIHYCHDNDNEPIQSYTFVDVHINGGENLGTNGGHIGTVYGGGNGVTIRGDATVFLNVQNPVNTHNHVDTIFGGNNKGDLVIVPDILLLHGQVGTVYGGCNRGAMTADANIPSGANTVNYLQTVGGYENIGSYVYLRATYEASSDSTHIVDAKVSEAVYGGCRMNGVTRNSLVLVEGGNHRDPNLYGGSDISGTVSGMSRVAVVGGTVGNVYGGGNGNYDYRDNGDVYTIPTSGNSAELVATGITNAPICAQSGADILGGTVGASGNGNQGSVFGGGYGHETSTTGDVTVNIGNATGSPTIYGDIYGGSAMGSVNTSASDVTIVNVLNGNITGDVYGGGLGRQADQANGITAIAATNNGKTYVNIGVDNSGTYTGNVTFNNGRVFGCNNQYGSPQDSVFVNIYKTAHGADAAHNLYPSEPSAGWNVNTLATNALTQTYAISAVYGGGNLAAYTPSVAERGSVVHVYGCDNTIHSVFGGGNAADVGTGDASTLSVTTRANTNVIVEGGRIHRVIGGGNGEDLSLPAANIFGTASTTVYAGLIDEVYGGANIQGSVDEINLLMSNPNSNSYNGCANYDDEVYGTVFGCANAAPYNKSVTTTIECGVGEIGALYGGSNQSWIGSESNHNSGVSVTLNLYGGEYVNVFAGSKGVAGSPGTPANIYGDVTLNLYGGTVTNAYGGSDANGNITGTITVNVLDREESNCGLDVTNIYGASNQTAYEPDNGSTRVSPVVNVIHIKNEESGVTYGIRGNVFGGGNLAPVTSNPKVNIGYLSGMTIPTGYPIAEAYRVAKVTGDVFGGGNQAGVTGNDTVIIRRDNSYANNLFGGGNLAGVTGNPVIIVEDGTVNTGIYGGCNADGTVTGNIEVNVLGGTLGVSGTPMSSGIFGGGYGAATQTSGNVTVNIGDASNAPTIYADVYGGSALGKVHATTSDVTTVNFAKGTLNGNLYGGGLGDIASLGGTHTNVAAEVNGSVVVNIGKDKTGSTIDGGLIYGSVFGANNINGSPKGSVTVNVYSAVTDSIFGGGNQSAYVPTTSSIAYPEVNVIGGEVIYKVVGGGNAAGVTANPTINISGGQVCTDNSTRKAGVYGGCNTSGTVTGDITINITGSTTNTTTIGTMTDLQDHKPVSVHGGGYGQATGTVGNITVNFGTDDGTSGHCEYPMLYGDLYGGSALGEVNSSTASPVDTTTINVLNGSLKYYEYAQGNRYYQEGGNIYGGGLGDKASLGTGHSDVAAKVWGEVHVNIGARRVSSGSQPFGQASLVHCNVYGCNNTNGSPQQNVYVDVYQTHHTSTDEASYMGSDRTYAIANVFGGGNEAHYHPEGNASLNWAKKTHTTIHYCGNTIENVYGGGNAADSDGTVVWVDGGRFNNIFAGGNGQVTEANIGQGSAHMTLLGGHVAYYFEGCNMHGEVGGHQELQIGCPTTDCECSTLVVENHYFGANQATVYGGIDKTVNCGDEFSFRKVYAGSRLAKIYGDLRLTIRGGQIQYLFGGCEGSADISADVKKYPVDWQTNQGAYDPELIAYMQHYFDSTNVDLGGKGGNIILTLEGGDIGTVFGGCDYRGIIEGTIQIIVDSTQTGTCGLDIDYIYGGNNLAEYTAPANTISPLVELKNGHVNYDVFGGSLGGDPTHLHGNGKLTGKPKVVVGDNVTGHKFRVGRDVFGGGSAGLTIGDTDVILQGKATIEGNVFGGGKLADVQGSTNVTIVPNNP